MVHVASTREGPCAPVGFFLQAKVQEGARMQRKPFLFLGRQHFICNDLERNFKQNSYLPQERWQDAPQTVHEIPDRTREAGQLRVANNCKCRPRNGDTASSNNGLPKSQHDCGECYAPEQRQHCPPYRAYMFRPPAVDLNCVSNCSAF